MQSFVPFVVFALLVAIGGVHSLSCYTCTSADDDRCTEDWPWTNFFNDPPTTTCVLGQCAKVVAYIGGEKLTTRSCLPVCVEAGGSLFGAAGAYTKCCSTDDCNSSSTARVNMFMLVITALAAALWKNI